MRPWAEARVAGLLAAAAIAGCGHDGAGVSQRNFSLRPAAPVERPSSAQGVTVRAGAPGVRYLETKPAGVAPGQTTDLAMRCPDDGRALDAYLAAAQAGVVMSYNARDPADRRVWDFGITNVDTTPREYSTGIVCRATAR